MHDHHHHELPAGSADNAALRRAYWIAIALNFAFVIVEFLAGRISHSVGLVSDAGHKMLDVLTLSMALVGFHLARRPSLDARRISAVIALVIVKSGVDMLRETISRILGERVDSQLARDLKATIASFPDVSGAYDLLLHSYGPELLVGSVHIEVPDTFKKLYAYFVTNRNFFLKVTELFQMTLGCNCI